MNHTLAIQSNHATATIMLCQSSRYTYLVLPLALADIFHYISATENKFNWAVLYRF